MLSKETEQKLVQLFITISIGEEKISKLKENILSNISINPIKVFYKLDTNNVGYLSRNDIYSFLNYFSVNYFPNDIDYIFYFYDKDNDNVISFYEFLDFIIPNSNYLYKKAYKKKYKYNKFNINELNEELDTNIEKYILEIFMEEINLARNLNNLTLNLKQYKDFMIQDVFYEIKSYSYITNDSLKAFFDRNEINYNDKFIKNIFIRFDNKEINGKISFNKFKNFFDLPYNNKNFKYNNKFIDNSNTITDNNNNNYIDDNNNIFMDNNITNNIIPTINQTYASDIKFSNSNTYSNFGYSSINKPNSNIYNNNNYDNEIDDNNNYCIINNDNYINEEDIQFQCSHLSRSGSIESNKDKNENFKYISNHNKINNNLYRNYLREKRSKSLEKSLSKSISRGSDPFPKSDKRIMKRNWNNIRDINPAYDEYNDCNDYNNNYNNNDYYNNDSFNEGYNNMNKSGSSFHEDIPIKKPVRLSKALVKRPLPERKYKNVNKLNFCYNNHYEDINMTNQINNSSIENEEYYPQNNNYKYYNYHNHNRNNNDYYNNQNRINFENEMENSYNDEISLQRGNDDDNDKFFSNNLDLKVYQEDISNKMNNGRY